jgi:hypothetical protein
MKSKNIWLATCILAVIFWGCPVNHGPDDENARRQISDYLAGFQCEGIRTPFSEYFSLGKITIKDRLVKGQDATVIAEVNATATAHQIDYFPGVSINKGSSVSRCFSFLTKDEQVKSGQANLVSEIPFEFERYESGWRIKGLKDYKGFGS